MDHRDYHGYNPVYCRRLSFVAPSTSVTGRTAISIRLPSINLIHNVLDRIVQQLQDLLDRIATDQDLQKRITWSQGLSTSTFIRDGPHAKSRRQWCLMQCVPIMQGKRTLHGRRQLT